MQAFQIELATLHSDGTWKRSVEHLHVTETTDAYYPFGGTVIDKVGYRALELLRCSTPEDESSRIVARTVLNVRLVP